mmetsp:Transcript_35399/g.89239  ORF Transcript_35399/g.89239 Transcript_35399/m.89239 type:complete len:256 (-) Transcript_35399:215-982(-)
MRGCIIAQPAEAAVAYDPRRSVGLSLPGHSDPRGLPAVRTVRIIARRVAQRGSSQGGGHAAREREAQRRGREGRGGDTRRRQLRAPCTSRRRQPRRKPQQHRQRQETWQRGVCADVGEDASRAQGATRAARKQAARCKGDVAPPHRLPRRVVLAIRHYRPLRGVGGAVIRALRCEHQPLLRWQRGQQATLPLEVLFEQVVLRVGHDGASRRVRRQRDKQRVLLLAHAQARVPAGSVDAAVQAEQVLLALLLLLAG